MTVMVVTLRQYGSGVVRSTVHSWFAEDWNLFLRVQIKFFVVVEILQEDIDFHISTETISWNVYNSFENTSS